MKKEPNDPVENPAFSIKRQKIPENLLAHWIQFFSPPKGNFDTPDEIDPTNPVPEFMESLGIANVNVPHTIEPDLMHGEDLEMWDGKKLRFFLFRHKHLKSPFNGGFFPGPIIRIPRGVIFHAKTHGHGPPPHTIHWHGIEPTPMNDGVGHCSFEIGNYTYQWQPNFVGTFFYHCHRSTVQHFKFGLYGLMIIEPPNAFDRGKGKNPGGFPRRTSANLRDFPEFPGFISGDLHPDDPEALTIPYDVEALWAVDDTDSNWNILMPDPRAESGKPGNNPGIDDKFIHADFHDFNPDYFFLSGKGFPGRRGEIVELPEQEEIPAALNSGVSGSQITVNAKTNQTILVRVLCAAYSSISFKFPVDGVIIGYDGRTLGIPVDRYNRPIPVKAGEALELTSARRLDFLCRSSTPVNDFAEIEYRNHRNFNEVLFTGKVPFKIKDGGKG